MVGGPSSLTFKTTEVNIDPTTYSEHWNVIYVTGEIQGKNTVNLVCNLNYILQAGLSTNREIFMVDQLCNPMPAVVSVAVNGTSYEFRLTQNASLIIEIDIKPGSSRNHVNSKSNGKIKVAILSSPVFNPVDVVSSSVRFGRTGIEVGGLPDKNHRALNNDGVPDIFFSVFYGRWQNRNSMWRYCC